MVRRDLQDFRLPETWDTYFRQIEKAGETFWASHHIHTNYVRIQSMTSWNEVRYWLLRIAETLLVKHLTAFETFLLHASAYLYEVGWQSPYGPELSLAERYTESGRMILLSRDASRRGYDFGLFGLDEIANALALLCAAVGYTDLSHFSLDPTPAGFQEQIHPRYLVALLQLADLLSISRANTNIIYNLPSLKSVDLADARFALQRYVKLARILPGGLKATFTFHPDDQHLTENMIALYEEPLRLWWYSNQTWLSRNFRFSFSIAPPERAHDPIPPPSLIQTCPALVDFLETFQPSVFPDPEDIHLEPPGPQPMERTSAFICYSNKDKAFLLKLHTYLKQYKNIDGERLQVWDATMIPAGTDWKSNLEIAMQRTKIAILLVSVDFLASDFIVHKELPPLLSAAEREGAVILPVVLTDCGFKDSDLAKFQAINSPDRPLTAMRRTADRDKVWQQVAERVREVLLAEH